MPNAVTATLAKRTTFPLMLCGFVLWGLLFIARSSYVVDGTRYFCLVDDAMVSMRYAWNLAHGAGAVWNVGERVEGFTNPLWMLIMAAVHCLGLPPNLTSLPVQLLSLAVLVLNLVGVHRLARLLSQNDERRAVCANVAVVCTMLLYSLNYWALMGLEVGLLACLCTWSVHFAVCDTAALRVSPWPWLLCAGATFVRLDAAVVGLALCGVCVLLNGRELRLRLLLWGIVPLAAALGVQTLMRWHYYDELLPNTYYLKMTGFPAVWRVVRGTLYSSFSFVSGAGLLFLIGMLGCGIQRQWRECRLCAIPLTVFAGIFAYSCYCGGDAWERVLELNRFLSVVAPLLAVASVVLFFHPKVAVVPATVFCIFCYFPVGSLGDLLLYKRPVDRKDNVRNTLLAHELRGRVGRDAVVAVEYAGTLPYFMPDNRMVDLLGKSDRHVARTAMHRGVLGTQRWREFYPGHLKWDYAYSIGQLRPDVICAIWKRNETDAVQYLGGYRHESLFGVDVYFLVNSE